MYYSYSDWSIAVFGLEYPHTEISRQKYFLNNYCGYFIKEIWLNNGLLVLCLDTLIQTLGMLLDFRRAKNTRLAARVFYAFFKCRNIPCVWIRVSKHGKSLGISLVQAKPLIPHNMYWTVYTNWRQHCSPAALVSPRSFHRRCLVTLSIEYCPRFSCNSSFS